MRADRRIEVSATRSHGAGSNPVSRSRGTFAGIAQRQSRRRDDFRPELNGNRRRVETSTTSPRPKGTRPGHFFWCEQKRIDDHPSVAIRSSGGRTARSSVASITSRSLAGSRYSSTSTSSSNSRSDRSLCSAVRWSPEGTCVTRTKSPSVDRPMSIRTSSEQTNFSPSSAISDSRTRLTLSPCDARRTRRLPVGR